MVKYLIEMKCDIHAKSKVSLKLLSLLLGNFFSLFSLPDMHRINPSFLHISSTIILLLTLSPFLVLSFHFTMLLNLQYNNTCLHQAAKGGHLEVAKLFLEMNCDVQVKGEVKNKVLIDSKFSFISDAY